MRRTMLNPLLLIFVSLLASACGEKLLASSTSTALPTLTSIYTPQPQNNTTTTKRSLLTKTPVTPSLTTTPDLPEGTPVAEWYGIPIMPNSIAGESREPHYSYITQATRGEVLEYYRKVLSQKQFSVISDGGVSIIYLGNGAGEILAQISIISENGFTRIEIYIVSVNFTPAAAAQHSVHPTGGSRRVFKPFAWLRVGSGKAALSRPTHPRVTHTVSPPVIITTSQ
jgi:hypothetical protein